MARKPSARVVLARGALTRVELGLADGLTEVARTIIESAEPPDATPFGQGLITRGGYLVYVGGKKIAGGGTDGKQPKKPRAFKVRSAGYIVGIVGWGFPARFQEFGTIKQRPQPFFMPAVNRVLPFVADIMRGSSNI